jgi:glycosyltransferase involved in cell wall biosynthesis
MQNDSFITEQGPLVSIIIPVYNGANYLRDAIDSALDQTYKNCEVLVIDDGSDDNNATADIAMSYGDRIRFFQKSNGGVATALNMGIEKMKGEFFSWLSHDDCYHPEKIKKQLLSLAEGHEEKNTISVCNSLQMDKDGNFIRDMIVHPRAARSVRCFLAIDADTGLNGCSLLIPSKLFETHGHFDPELKVTQDYDMWFRMAETAKFVFIPDILLSQRIHEDQGGVKQYADIATPVSDKLHADFINSISIDELLLYCDKDYEYLVRMYNIYKHAYFKTANGILKALIKIYILENNPESAAKLINSYLLGGSMDTAYTFLKLVMSDADKPRILVYCNAWIGGGLERVYSTVLKSLYHKYEFIILVGQRGYEPERYNLPSDITMLHIALTDRLLLSLYQAANILDVSIFIGNPNYSIDFLPIYHMFSDTKIKTIAWCHMFYFISKEYPALYPLIIKMNEYFSAASVTTWSTSFSANSYSFFAANGALMPNPNSFNNTIMLKHTPPFNTILSVARFDDDLKRVDRLFKVFKLVLNEMPDATLVLVGRYDPDMIIQGDETLTVGDLLDNLNIRGSLFFVGETDNITDFYKRTNALVLTSSAEGFGLVLTEAAQHGTPSIIFDIPGLDDIITDGVNGFVVPQDDLQGMADKIVLLLKDSTLLRTLRENAYAMSGRFDQEIICKRWDKLLSMLLSTEKQEDINKKLSENFMSTPNDSGKFTKYLSHEYDGMLRRYYNEYYVKNQEGAL